MNILLVSLSPPVIIQAETFNGYLLRLFVKMF